MSHCLAMHSITEVVPGKGDERQRQILQFSDEIIYFGCQKLNIYSSGFIMAVEGLRCSLC